MILKKSFSKKSFLTVLNFFVLCGFILGSSFSSAQTKQSQLQCRTKSKEAAKTAYNDCIELAKGDEIENIRKEFKAKVVKLKEYYEKKLKKAAAKIKKNSKNGPMQASDNNANTLPTSLPTKVQNEDSKGENNSFNVPTPVNTQETVSAQIDSPIQSSNIDSSTSTKSSSSGYSNDEPTIELKEAPKTLPPPPYSDTLEGEPDSTI